MTSLWSRIADVGPAAVVLTAATVALLALPALRRLAPRARRHRGRAARFVLGVALLLAASALALGTMGAASPGNLLQLVALVALALGLVGLGGLVVFDVVLPRLRIDVPTIVGDLVLVTIAGAIGMGLLRLAGLDVFSLVTTSAVLTAVVGLALQSTIADVFGGLALQLDRTLRRGEWIEAGDHVGKIVEIGWRCTRIHTKDGDIVFVPNGELVSKDVRSLGRTAGAHRVKLRVGFDYRHPPHEVRRTLLAAVRGTPGVADRPAPECGPAEFGETAVVYALRYWITDFAHEHTIDEEVHARLWYAAQRAGLEIPFPTRKLVTYEAAAGARAAAAERDEERVARSLATTAPFDALDDDRRRRCARGVRRLEFGRGEQVLPAEDAADALFLVDAGELTVQVGANGSTRDVATVRPGELVGPMVAVATRCMAASEAVLYRFDERALAEVPELHASLSLLAAARQAAVC